MRLKTAVFICALASTVAMASLASAADALPNPLLQRMRDQQGFTVTFMGHAHGLDGWLLEKQEGDKKAHKYVYTTADGALVAGILVSPDGESFVTEQQVRDMKARQEGNQAAAAGAEAAKAEKAEKFYAQTEKASWVSLGAADAPYVYAFINTTCDHCHAFWKDIASAVKAGRVQLRLLPFGEKDENKTTGAALLSVENPLQAWEAFAAGDQTALSPDKIKEGALQKLADNGALVREWKLPSTPFIIYRKPADGVVTAIAGKPENIMLLLADMIKK